MSGQETLDAALTDLAISQMALTLAAATCLALPDDEGLGELYAAQARNNEAVAAIIALAKEMNAKGW